MRGSGARLLRMTPGAPRRNAPALSAGDVTEKDNLVFRLGMYGATLTPALASTLAASAAARACSCSRCWSRAGRTERHRARDVVHAVNGTAVTGGVSAQYARSRPDGGPIVLQIERAGMLSYVAPAPCPAPTSASRGPVPHAEGRCEAPATVLGRTGHRCVNRSRDRQKVRKNAPASERWQAEACPTIADKQPAALWDSAFALSTDFFSFSGSGWQHYGSSPRGG